MAPGMPSNIAHDMHRLIGWTCPLGLYIDGRMVRVLGAVDEAVTDEEKADLSARGEAYWAAHHRDGAAPFRADLVSRLGSVDLQQAEYIQLEAVVAKRIGLAAELYPNLFTPGVGYVDKDGLVDYRKLVNRMEQIQLGVFHDHERDLLLFAHRFYRRSLSHRNKLNEHFLQSFVDKAKENTALNVRLRLDPDIIGHPASATNLIELEYWRGPRFSEDISSIPNGVAEHKADERTRFYEDVDRTQIWWKAPELRRSDDSSFGYRTFEVEELIENPSGGLPENNFGCRYAHAEFSTQHGVISHFDGAIRAYAGEPYLERIETSIDRAGKYANYTKLFRFDGALTISAWKQLLCDYFKGNKLIPEYLGASNEAHDNAGADEPSPQIEKSDLELAALISLECGSIKEAVALRAERLQQIGNEIVPFIEIGNGEVARYLRTRFDLTATSSVGFSDDILNLPKMAFAASENLNASFNVELLALTKALRQDISAGLTRRLSVAFAWETDRLITNLSVAGDAEKVVATLEGFDDTVDLACPPRNGLSRYPNWLRRYRSQPVPTCHGPV